MALSISVMKPAFAVAIVLASSIHLAACGESGPTPPAATATVSGVVRSVMGNVIVGATVKVSTATATTDATGQFELQNLPVGVVVTVTTTATDFDSKSTPVILEDGDNTLEVELNPVDKGQWGSRSPLLVANSEF